jgi:4-hydroxybenzoate polyprenyltransferase
VLLLKRIADIILFGNIYIALGTVCLIQSTLIQIGQTDHFPAYSVLSFFATLLVYNFQRIFYKKPQGNSSSIRRIWIAEHQLLIRSLAAIGFIGAGISFFFNDYKILIYLLPLLVLCILYFIPFIKLRKNPWLKLLTLVSVWTMVTAVVPILLVSTTFNQSAVLHISVRFIFMVAICIPFDIRDLQLDKEDAVITIPHLTGEKNAKWLAFACMTLYGILILLEYWSEMINLPVMAALISCAVISAIIVLMSSTKRSEYFYVAGIDGTMLVQGGLVLLANYL